MSGVPQDLAAERIVLGAMLSSPAAAQLAADRLTEELFYKPAHGVVFAAILAARAAGEPVEPVALTARLAASGDLGRVGGAPYLSELVEAVPVAAQVGFYVERLLDLAARRALVVESERLARAAALEDGEARTAAVVAVRDRLARLDADPVANGRRLVLTPASAIEPEPVVWAWRPDGGGRIPAGSLSIGAGREGAAKSTFGVWLAAQITRGTLPGAFHGTPRAVVYAAVEDSWRYTLVPRLIAAGADLTRVFQVEVYDQDALDVTLSLPSDLARLEEQIKAHHVALIVLDPLMSTIGAKIDTHRERDVRTALDPLARLAERTGCVIFGIAHFSKSSGTDPSSLITGSGAFKNVPRSVFGFAVDPEDGTRVMTQTKNSLGMLDELPSLSYAVEDTVVPTRRGDAHVGKLVWLGESDRSVTDILGDTGSEDREDRADAAAWLRSYLADNGGEAEAVDVFKAGDKNGFSRDALKRAKRKAGVISRKEGMDTGWMWVLDLEGSAKSAKGAESGSPHSSLPSRSLRAVDTPADAA